MNRVVVMMVLGLALVGCPEKGPEAPGNLPELASCEVLHNWQREGAETWHQAIRKPDGTYVLCGKIHTGAVEGQCILPLAGEAVMVEGQTESYAHHLVVGRQCLDDMYGGISGRCQVWNCENVWEKAGDSPGCTALSARRAGTCDAMWGSQ